MLVRKIARQAHLWVGEIAWNKNKFIRYQQDYGASISTCYHEPILSGRSHLGRKSFVAMSANVGRFFKIPATSMTSAAAFNARSVIRPSRL